MGREGIGREGKEEKTDFTQNDLREVTLDTKKLSNSKQRLKAIESCTDPASIRDQRVPLGFYPVSEPKQHRSEGSG